MRIIPIVIGALGTVPKGLEKRLKELEIGQNIEKSHEDQRRLSVTQTSLKDYQITLV